MKRSFVLFLAALVLAACGGSPAPAADAPTAAPTALPRPSEGLGLPRSTWETLHGTGIEAQYGLGLDYGYGLNVAFQNDPSGAETVWFIEQMWGDENAHMSDAARSLARFYSPQDSQLVRAFVQNGRDIELYHSEWLKSRFPEVFKFSDGGTSEAWNGGNPGDFIVLYRADESNRITSFVISIGNNP